MTDPMEEVNHLFGPRQPAEVAVNDNAVEAVVGERQQVTEQQGEQFHGSPPKTRQGSIRSRSRRAARRSAEF